MNRPLDIARSGPAPSPSASTPADRAPSRARSEPAAAAIHVRIGRVVIDAGALDGADGGHGARGDAARRELEARLHAALSPLLAGAETTPRPLGGGASHEPWVRAVAADIAARLRSHLPETNA